MRRLETMTSEDAVLLVTTVSDEALFGFEAFPLMVCVSQELNVDCVCCVNRIKVIEKEDEHAYLYKD